MSINKVILLGRIGGDPELKFTPSGTAVCNVSIATSQKWKDKSDKQQEKTEWSRVVAWGKQAELLNKYVSKGDQLYIEGRMETRNWDNKEGVKVYTTEVILEKMDFISGNSDKNKKLKEMDDKKSDYNISSDSSFASDDIPF